MTGCGELRGSLGVYVLGAIDPAERNQLETHLEACPSCRDELAGLAGLPALLGRVTESQIAQVAGPPEELLDSLLARAAAERKSSWKRSFGGGARLWAPLAVAAAVLLAIGALAGVRIAGGLDDGERPVAIRTVTPTPPPPTKPAKAEEISAKSPDRTLEAHLMLLKKRWGTAVEIYLRGVPKGASCRLYAVAKDGRRDMLGSWYVPYSRGYGEYHGSTMFQRDQLFSFEVVTVEGQPLLTIPA
ncbi:anti-sigma factor family protein [Spirillospora sp. NPDC048911]|uniref:anti-sigma factor family protein n=1 Tax=Spirillospora sp. NPDC048911 TaxID=3364527 RepID=UPI00371CE93E